MAVLSGYAKAGFSDGAAAVAQAQERLDRDSEEYRVFLLRRCEQEGCRPS